MRKKIIAVQVDWRNLAHVITAHLLGVETPGLSGSLRKKVGRKRAEDSAEESPHSGAEAVEVSEPGAEEPCPTKAS